MVSYCCQFHLHDSYQYLHSVLDLTNLSIPLILLKMVIIASVHRKSIFPETDWKERECKIIHDPGANSKIVKPYIYIYTNS